MLGDGTSLTPFENPGKVRIEWEQVSGHWPGAVLR